MTKTVHKQSEIAIIGMSCRFPKASSITEFWNLLNTGLDPITELPSDRWQIKGHYDPDPKKPGKMISKLGGFISDIDLFDAPFFSISDKEAETLDPQQRILLEQSWIALEHAGIPPYSLKGSRTGVFVGISYHDYGHLIEHFEKNEEIDSYQLTGNLLSAAAGRLAYFFDLRGQSMSIDTSTSSSLVALHNACQDLRDEDCDLAIAAGVNLILSPIQSIALSKTHVLSKDGRCKTFDADANGYVRSEGCGVVILKRLEDAIKDNNPILGVIKSTVVNQDGHSSDLIAPNQEAQEMLLKSALAAAELKDEDIDFIEAHGSATLKGDLAEVSAIENVYGKQAGKRAKPLLLGSVKSNIGHLEAASGIAGLIKVVLALQNNKIPANLHLNKLNPNLPINQAKIVAKEHQGWLPSPARKRRAGISSFGFTGTNVHLILEEAPELTTKEISHDESLQLLVISAKSEAALEEQVKNYLNYIADSQYAFADIAYSTRVGREAFNHRLAFLAHNNEEALLKIASGDYLKSTIDQKQSAKIAFLFGEFKEEYRTACEKLYESYPVFKSSLDACASFIQKILNLAATPSFFSASSIDKELINFSLSYALAKLWLSWGLTPSLVAGLGSGTFAAGVIVEALTLREAFQSLIQHKKFLQENAKTQIPFFKFDVNEMPKLIELLREQDFQIGLEMGPPSLILQASRGLISHRLLLPSLTKTQELQDSILEVCAKLWVRGASVNLSAITPKYTQVPLPHYPFQRKHYWAKPLEHQPQLHQAIPSLSPLETSQVPISNLKKAFLQVAPNERKRWLMQYLQKKVQEVLKVPEVNIEKGFFELGFTSVMTIEIYQNLQNDLGKEINLSETLFFDYPNITALADYLSPLLLETPQEKHLDSEMVFDKSGQSDAVSDNSIAIIGVGCRLPGGVIDTESYWNLLQEGKDAIEEIPRERWNLDEYYDSDPEVPGKMSSRFGGFLSRVDEFDASFFGISPLEAESLDPQQRIVLEAVWEALENAAINPQKLNNSSTAVIIGVSNNDYWGLEIKEASRSHMSSYLATGIALSSISGRISYLLGLHGPSFSIDTACSSSLVAVHEACQKLKHQESDLVIAGGVNLILLPEMTVNYSKVHMLAKDGRCKTFDSRADGYVRSEGCGIVILKRLKDAIRDKNPILAVIKGSCVNQDGSSSGLTVPNKVAQENLMQAALKEAGVDAHTIQYLEAHGTGTSLGDPIELGAIVNVYGKGRALDNPLFVGSVKTNIGHLESAAGIAGLIKTALSLSHRTIPKHLNFIELNPKIHFGSAPIKIPLDNQAWQNTGFRRAAVSSFGSTGTNAHVILEEAPDLKMPSTSIAERPLQILILSAKSEKALKDIVEKYSKLLEGNATIPFADFAYTANTGRAHLDYRLTIIAENNQQALLKLKNREFTIQKALSLPPKVAFKFTEFLTYPSQYEVYTVFKKALELCCIHFEQELGIHFSIHSFKEGSFKQSKYFPCLSFTIQYALAELWKSWGIIPDYVIGKESGELAAAVSAGVLKVEDAIKLISASCHSTKNELAEIAKNLQFHPPQLTMISSVTGQPVNREELTGDYWANQIASSAAMNKGLELLHSLGCKTIIEIGLPLDWKSVLETLSLLFLMGREINWEAFDAPYNRIKRSLPTYPFQRKSYWFVSTKPTPPSPPVAEMQKTPSVPEPKAVEQPPIKEEPPPKPIETPAKEERLDVYEIVKDTLCKVLRYEREEIDEEKSFFDYGMDSLTAVQFSQKLQTALKDGCEINSTIAFNYPSIKLLSQFIEETLYGKTETAPLPKEQKSLDAEQAAIESEIEGMSESETEKAMEEMLKEMENKT